MASFKDLPKRDPVPRTGPGPRWRGRLIVLLFGIVAAGVVARAARGSPEPASTAATRTTTEPGGMTGLVPTTTPTGDPQPTGKAEEKGTIDKILPFVTEGGIAMILGLLLGMVTRSVIKFFVFFLFLGFVGIQYLHVKGVIDVDWGALKDFVLNMVPKGASLGAIVQRKLPSLGAFGLGYLLGLKRG